MHIFPHLSQLLASIIDDIPGVYQPTNDLEGDINSLALRTVSYAGLLLLILVIAAIFVKERQPRLKMPLFVLITITMVGSTLTLFGSTIYLNLNSYSGGPAHWHADFEIWACGNELELRDPTGFSNKIGTSTLHEHNDHRIHLEGVVVDAEVDASLGKFFHVIGGAITDSDMVVPLNPADSNTFEDEIDGDGPATKNPQFVDPYVVQDGDNGRVAYFQDNQTCGQQEAEVQVFVYSWDETSNTYSQAKIENPRDYVITDNPNVPPGDCIIFEFDVAKSKTDKLCEQYGIRDIERCVSFGVEGRGTGICTAEQVDYDSSVDYRIYPPQQPQQLMIDATQETESSDTQQTPETEGEDGSQPPTGGDNPQTLPDTQGEPDA